MKKQYTAPIAEKIRFQYAEQVVASAGETDDGTLDYNDIVNRLTSFSGSSSCEACEYIFGLFG